MSATSCTIQFMGRPGKAVNISMPLLRALGLENVRSIRLSLGSKSIATRMNVLKIKGHCLQLSTAAIRQLKLPHLGRCLVVRRGDSSIQIGPLIGIFTASGLSGTAPVDGAALRKVMNAGKGKSYYFAFGPQDVNWKDKTVAGHFPQPSGAWRRRIIPLPDVIYNRFLNRRLERTSSVNSLKERFVERGTPIFNWGFYDKGAIYNLLKGDRVAKHMPETCMSPSVKQIKDLLEKHKTIYLKPTSGSLGIGIYRLAYNPRNGYIVRSRRNGKNVELRYTSFSSLASKLMRKLRLHHYIAQQGISVIQLNSCPIDFRFHMTKDGHNQWSVAGIGAKKSGRGGVTTHVHSGGLLLSADRVLKTFFGARAEKVKETATETAIELAKAIEHNSAKTVGEIGFDIGIDSSGQIWMFEANAKPGRTIFKHASLRRERETSIHNLFEYSLYLSKFKTGVKSRDPS